MNKEIWKIIPGYEGLYKISNIGNVFSIRRNKILKAGITNKGYKNKLITKNIHRLVLLAFIGKSKLHINHKNGIKTDNRLENLEYCTPSQNMRHALKNKLVDIKKFQGENNHRSKLTKKQVLKIRSLYPSCNQKLIAKKFNISKSTVSFILSKKRWKHI